MKPKLSLHAVCPVLEIESAKHARPIEDEQHGTDWRRSTIDEQVQEVGHLRIVMLAAQGAGRFRTRSGRRLGRMKRAGTAADQCLSAILFIIVYSSVSALRETPAT